MTEQVERIAVLEAEVKDKNKERMLSLRRDKQIWGLYRNVSWVNRRKELS